MTATGWTFDQVDALFIPEAAELIEYWRDNPPVHVLLAGLLRTLGGNAGGGTFQPSSEEDIRALAGEYGAA